MKWLMTISLLLTMTIAEGTKFTLLSFNDIYEITSNKQGVGGLASMKALLDRERQKQPHSITALCGDFLFPSLLSIYDMGKHRIELFNLMEVDVASLGNHEFDFGPDILKKRLSEARFVPLATNVIGLEGKSFTGEEQTILYEFGEIKVGVFGLAHIESPQFSVSSGKLHFMPVEETAKMTVEELRNQGADVIIALTHSHINDDRALARAVPEIDFIIGGHDHMPTACYEGRTLIVKSGYNGQYLTRVDVEYDKGHLYTESQFILNKEIAPDPLIEQRVAFFQSALNIDEELKVCFLSSQLDTTCHALRSGENEFGNFIADAIREAMDADVAIICSGMVKGDNIYEPNSILTRRDLLKELPYTNNSVLIELKGEDLIHALENGVSLYGEDDGRFPQVSGMKFTFSGKRQPGYRISQVSINGYPINPHAYYTVATVDYLLNGGDGYSSFSNGKVIIGSDEGIDTLSLVEKAMKRHTSFSPRLDQRITIKN
jgi:5'-nucleotidase / UDP-sugar diphosphatase